MKYWFLARYIAEKNAMALIYLLQLNIFNKVFFSQCHSVEKWKIYSHQKFFPSNQLFSDLFSKFFVFTKFLPKKPESKFPKFPHCECGNYRIFVSLRIYVKSYICRETELYILPFFYTFRGPEFWFLWIFLLFEG